MSSHIVAFRTELLSLYVHCNRKEIERKINCIDHTKIKNIERIVEKPKRP